MKRGVLLLIILIGIYWESAYAQEYDPIARQQGIDSLTNCFD